MGDQVVLFVRAGQPDSEAAEAFLRKNGFRPTARRDLAASPATSAEIAAVARGLAGDLWPAVDTRHADYGSVLPRGAEGMSADGLAKILTERPDLVRAPILVTPKGALAGFRERQWARFLGVGAELRG